MRHPKPGHPAGKAEEIGPNAETESEPSVDVCQADQVAYITEGGTQVLSAQCCRDAARQSPVFLLVEDAAVSDT
eukprot:7044146-Pyramimonas_sp.AAC.1